MIHCSSQYKKKEEVLISTKHKKVALTWVQILMQNSMNPEGAHGLKIQTAKCTGKSVKGCCLQRQYFSFWMLLNY